MTFAATPRLVVDAVMLRRPPRGPVLAALETLVRRYGRRRTAALLGVADKSVWNWRTGGREVAHDTAMRIIDLVNTPPERIEETWQARVKWLETALNAPFSV